MKTSIIMKNIKSIALKKSFVMFLILTAWMSACNPEYNLELPLAVNSDELHLSAQEGSTYMQVYATGKWKASFKNPVGWAAIDDAEGDGNGKFFFSYDENKGIGRKIIVGLNKDELNKEIVILQSGKDPSINFPKTQVILPATSASVHLPLESNLAGEDAEMVQTEIQYEDENAGEWITNVVIKNDAFEFYVTQNNMTITRSAQVTLRVTNLNPGSNYYGDEITCSVRISQAN
jgi:hypothetical protein